MNKLFLTFIISSFLSSAFTKVDLDCLENFHKKYLNQQLSLETSDSSKVFIKKSENYISYIDADAPVFQAIGELQKDGSLDLIFLLKDKENIHSKNLRGQEMFANIIEYFGPEKIKKINGFWIKGDNLNAFNTSLKNGLTFEEAAKQTWTGKQAAKYGYTEAIIKYTEKNRDGQYIKVKVQFEKP